MNLMERATNWFNGTPDNIAAPVEGHYVEGLSIREAAGLVHELLQASGEPLLEAYTQADIELALDDRGWLVGGKRMAGELDPLSRQVQVNRSRYYWLRDPLVKHAVRLYTDYAFGAEAMTYSCDEDKDGVKTPNDDVMAKLDKFMKNRKNKSYTSRRGQRRLSHKLLVDGELFFAFYDDGIMRCFDCLQMTNIVTDGDDEETVIAYERTIAPRPGEVPRKLYYKPWDADDDEPNAGVGEVSGMYFGADGMPIKNIKFENGVCMYHLPLDALDKRGNTLIGACSDWAKELRRFMTARVAIAEALSKFAFKGTVKGGQKVINSIRAKMESSFSQTGLSGGTEHNPPNAPGATWFQNDGINLEAMPRATGASDAKTDSDNLKLQFCAGTGIMLHYFGDPSTGNLATATAMELPMLKMFGAYQYLWKDAWRDIFSIVLGEGPDDEPANVGINMPDILDEDLQALSAFITSLTTVFPEAKVPAVMRRCLTAMEIENIEEVIEDIAENKQEQADANAALVTAGTHIAGPDGTVVPKPEPPVVQATKESAENELAATASLARLEKLLS